MVFDVSTRCLLVFDVSTGLWIHVEAIIGDEKVTGVVQEEKTRRGERGESEAGLVDETPAVLLGDWSRE